MLKIFLIITLFSFNAFSAEKPKEISGFIKANSPYGSGSLKKLIFHAYDAELWTDADKWSYSAPFALSIIYKMSFSTDELVERTFEEMNANKDLQKEFNQQLRNAFPDVKDGDRITAYYLPKQGIKFFHNAIMKQEIKDEQFARKFLDIWLGKSTSEPELREDLLKGAS